MAATVHTLRMGVTALSLEAPKRVCDAYQLQGRHMIMSMYGRNRAHPSMWCDGALFEAPKRVYDPFSFKANMCVWACIAFQGFATGNSRPHSFDQQRFASGCCFETIAS